jgi:N-acetyl-gamma-glutamyl-phosphate reductase
MIKAGILGATGYTARVLIELLLGHSQVEITVLTSRRDALTALGDIHPSLAGRLDLQVERLTAPEAAERCDCLFSCLPHAASAAALVDVDPKKTAVVDFSADYRLWDAAVYKHWYGAHPRPEQLATGQIPYGLPERFRAQIRGARFVANPGCYPTSAILAMAPLLQRKLVEPQPIIFDSKSGVSGAGRTPSLATLFPECNESVSAYKIGEHRHTPEIAQILGDAANGDVDILFTPHLIPMDRGILTTGYARLQQDLTTEEVLDVLREAYYGEPFVRVTATLPTTKQTVGTNHCVVSARVVGRHVTTISCIDNLMKGASGAAVQNMNLMFGFEETLGLV